MAPSRKKKKPNYAATIIATAAVSAVVTLIALNSYKNTHTVSDTLKSRDEEETEFYFVDPEYIVFKEQLQEHRGLVTGLNAHLLNEGNFTETYDLIRRAVTPVQYNRTLVLTYKRSTNSLKTQLSPINIFIPYRINFDSKEEEAELQKCITSMQKMS